MNRNVFSTTGRRFRTKSREISLNRKQKSEIENIANLISTADLNKLNAVKNKDSF